MKPQLADPSSLKRSNLAFALRILPRDRHNDAAIFYRFCRAVDDLADDEGLPVESRQAGLEAWSNAVQTGEGLPAEMAELIGRAGLDRAHLAAIIEGCQRDLHPQRFDSIDELRGYCWQVACAVGLVSARLFGCKDPRSDDYAQHLGYALQFTNILRDLGEDARAGRVYLPGDLLANAGCHHDDVLARNPKILPAVHELAGLVRGEFAEAERQLPPIDAPALRPARIMASLYSTLLDKVLATWPACLSRRIRLSPARKLLILMAH